MLSKTTKLGYLWWNRIKWCRFWDTDITIGIDVHIEENFIQFLSSKRQKRGFSVDINVQHVIKALPVVIKTSESNNLKGDPLEIQYPKSEKSRLGLIESVHERWCDIPHRLAPVWAQLVYQTEYWTLQSQKTRKCKNNNTISICGVTF